MPKQPTTRQFFEALFHAAYDRGGPQIFPVLWEKGQPIKVWTPRTKELLTYFHVGALEATRVKELGPHSRASKTDVACVTFLWVDYDDAKVGMPQDDLMMKLSYVGMRPQVAVRTGGGYHLYWVLEEPMDAATGERYCRALQQAIRELVGPGSEGLLDSTHDCTRVLRVPGTMNTKYGSLVRVTHLEEGVFLSLDDLHDFLEDRGVSDLLVEQEAAPVEALGDGFDEPSELQMQMLRQWDDRTDALLDGKRPRNPRKGEHELFQDASSIDFRLVCSALRSAGVAYQCGDDDAPLWTDNQLAWLIAEHHRRDPQTKAGKAQRRDYVFERTIPKAREVTQIPPPDATGGVVGFHVERDDRPVKPNTAGQLGLPSFEEITRRASERSKKALETSLQAGVQEDLVRGLQEAAGEGQEEPGSSEPSEGPKRAEGLGERVMRAFRAACTGLDREEPDIQGVWVLRPETLTDPRLLVKLGRGENARRVFLTTKQLLSRALFAEQWTTEVDTVLPRWPSSRADEWLILVNQVLKHAPELPEEHRYATVTEQLQELLQTPTVADRTGTRLAGQLPALVTLHDGREAEAFPLKLVGDLLRREGYRGVPTRPLHALGLRKAQLRFVGEESTRRVTVLLRVEGPIPGVVTVMHA